MRKVCALILLVVVVPSIGIAQKIDNLASFRDIKSVRYFRFNYENDLFAGSDKDYTQGYSLELLTPFLTNNPINYIFFKPKKSEVRFGLAFEHIGFTPDRYDLKDIQYGDRPFASAMMLKSFMIAVDTLHASRFTSSFSIGIIGPTTLGKEVQTAIHKVTGSVMPEGWHNQVKNDVVLNYEAGYEKQLLKYRDLFSLQANANAKLGTLFTNGSLGFNTTFGIINSPFLPGNKRKKFVMYVYAQPLINVVGYDATLQGGVFNGKSPYTIPAEDIERFTGQLNYGVVIKFKALYFEYSRSVITREFETGSSANWGGLRCGFTF